MVSYRGVPETDSPLWGAEACGAGSVAAVVTFSSGAPAPHYLSFPTELDRDEFLEGVSTLKAGGTVPTGLPSGITETEKKLWLALFVRARERMQQGAGGGSGPETVRDAVDRAIDDVVTEKHSLEYRFCVRWSHSVKTCLAMRQNYRSSDVYS